MNDETNQTIDIVCTTIHLSITMEIANFCLISRRKKNTKSWSEKNES